VTPADGPPPLLHEASVADLQAALAAGRLTATRLVGHFLARIAAYDRAGPGWNAVLEVNPEAEAIAGALDRERAAGKSSRRRKRTATRKIHRQTAGSSAE
jgi:amidase